MGSLTPKEFAERNQERAEEAQESVKNMDIEVRTFTGRDIEFYRHGRRSAAVDQFFGLDEDLRPEAHWELDFPATTKDDARHGYTVSLDPQEVYLEQVEGFLDFAEENISSRREGKLDFVEKALYDSENIDFDTATDWFDRRDEVDFGEFNENLTEDETLELGKDEKVLEQTVDEYWDDLKQNEELSNEERVQRGLLMDTVKSLQGVAFQRDDEFKQTVDDYELFLRRFQPEQYAELAENEHDYEVVPIFGSRYHDAVVKGTGSCLAADDYDEVREQHSEDPFTFIHAIGRDGDLRGYMRSFVMEDDSGDNFLGIDTIEVPKKGGIDLDDITEYFEEEKDVLKAGVMGAICMGETMDLDYIAGRDARVKFGLRQPYSNTQKKLNYRKLGDPVPYYSVAIREEEEELGRYPSEDEEFRDVDDFKMLMEDRKGAYFDEDVYFREEGDDVAAYRTRRHKVPGFDEFPNPDEQELRGFRTEDGWHTNHAYILMEFPEN